MKQCNACNINKDESEYHKRSDRAGLRSVCKPCYRVVYKAPSTRKTPLLTAEQRKENKKLSLKKHRSKPESKVKNAARQSIRRAIKENATPKWLTAEQLEWMRLYYQTASMFTEATGQNFEVDHIEPLRGKDICGLHVPWNLQLMVDSANRQKGNRRE